MMPQHSKERFFNRQVQAVKLDTLDAHAPVEQCARAVVIRTRHRNPHLSHARFPRSRRRDLPARAHPAARHNILKASAAQELTPAERWAKRPGLTGPQSGPLLTED